MLLAPPVQIYLLSSLRTNNNLKPYLISITVDLRMNREIELILRNSLTAMIIRFITSNNKKNKRRLLINRNGLQM